MAYKILVVDDDRIFIKTASVRLASAGYEVVTAMDGLEGLNKARSVSPDLVMLDGMMPKMYGFEVCRLLKFDSRYKHIPVIMLSAAAETSDRVLGQKVGVNDYVAKPPDYDQLLTLLQKYLVPKKA